MDDLVRPPAITADTRQARRNFALKLHEIEGNPLDAEDLALFKQFDRECLSDEQRVARLTALAKTLAAG